ncbi:hypothetical protein PENTCL1PPCAC_4986, partial [Pristionchus entomophagus]
EVSNMNAHGRKSCMWSIRRNKHEKIQKDLKKWRNKASKEDVECIKNGGVEDERAVKAIAPEEYRKRYADVAKQTAQRSLNECYGRKDKVSHPYSRNVVKTEFLREFPTILKKKVPVSRVVPSDWRTAPADNRHGNGMSSDRWTGSGMDENGSGMD